MIKFKRKEEYRVSRSMFGGGEYTIHNSNGVMVAYGPDVFECMEKVQQFDLSYGTKSQFTVKPYTEFSS